MKPCKKLLLSHVSAKTLSGKSILQDMSMTFESGKIHVIMGPNGSGKSTLANVLMGNPLYTMKGKIVLGTTDISKLTTQERAKRGLFLAFQSPIAISGVSVINLLRTAYQEIHPGKKSKTNDHNSMGGKQWSSSLTIHEFIETTKKYAAVLQIDDSLLSRSIHEGFSGGERKKIELLQSLVLAPEFAVFDEIDTGLDVDALQIVARGIELVRQRGTGCIIITHYQRLLSYLHVDTVMVMKKGCVVKTGDATLIQTIEEKGYATT